MSELEKIINGLETCIKSCNGGFVCLDCNYSHDHEGGCEAQLLQDALDLLKAQRPRVMTLEEIRAIYHYREEIEGRVSNDPVVIAAKCATTVDAVPVVLCKNCTHWTETGEGYGECELHEVADSDPSITHAFQTDFDWFCADGEQKDGGENDG